MEGNDGRVSARDEKELAQALIDWNDNYEAEADARGNPQSAKWHGDWSKILRGFLAGVPVREAVRTALPELS